MLLRAAALAAVVPVLAACGGSEQPAATTSALPPGCTVPEARAIVVEFLRRPSFAPEPFFDVYASYESDGRKFVARAPARALAHLRGRERLGERDRLIALRVGEEDVNHARIRFDLTRAAPDFAERGIHNRLASGAGTLDCAHGKVAAWVMKGP